MTNLKDLHKLHERTEDLLRKAESYKDEASLHQDRYTQALKLLTKVASSMDGKSWSDCSGSCSWYKGVNALIKQIKEFLNAKT